MKRMVAPATMVVGFSLLAFFLESYGAGDGDALAGVLAYGETAIHAAIWFVGAWFLKRLIEYGFARSKTDNGEQTIPKLTFDLIGAVLFLGALIGVVGAVFGMPVNGLLTTSGLLTGVVAFAIRDLIADVFAGIALAIERPIKIGDWLQFDGGTPAETGRVVEMNWRAVRMVTVQGRTMIFPNNLLSRRDFVNLSKPERYFRTVKRVCVDFSVPPDRIVDIIMSAIKATPGVVESQSPLILIDEMNERGTVFSIHFWVPDYPAMFMIERQVMVNVINFLDQAGYSPAYPKNEIDLSWRHRREISKHLDISDLLRRVSLFKTLTEDEREQLAERLEVVKYPAGTAVVHEHDAGDSLFVVLTGLVKATKATDKGEVEVGRVQPGEVFGEMSLLTGLPRSATVATVTDTAVVEIKRDHLQPLLEANSAIIDRLGELEAARINTFELVKNASDADRAEIDDIGMKAYLKRQISRFFNIE